MTSVSTEGGGSSAPSGKFSNFEVLRLLLVASETLLSIGAIDQKIFAIKIFSSVHRVKKIKHVKNICCRTVE